MTDEATTQAKGDPEIARKAGAARVATLLAESPVRRSGPVAAPPPNQARRPVPTMFEPRLHLPASMSSFPLLRLEFAARSAENDPDGWRAGPAGSEAMKIELNLSADEITALARLGHEVGANTPDAAKTALRDWLISHGYLDRQAQPKPEENQLLL